MKKFIPISIFCLLAIGIVLAIVTFPPIYAIAVMFVLVLVGTIFLKVIKPIWIIAIVFVCTPFIDVFRAAYLSNVPFIGIYQELILLLLIVSKIISTRDGIKLWRFGLIDFLIIGYIIWNLFEIIQSPSILGGLYAWRWYSIGPLTYLVFRLYSFTKHECTVIIASICIGLVAASIYIFYQYFVLGPETAAQISQSLGFTAFFRIGWRLPGPFSSPLVASASFSILVLAGMALLPIKRFSWMGFCLIIIGGLAIFFTLSRSGVAITLVGLFAILMINIKKVRWYIIPAFIGLLLVLQFAYLVPIAGQFIKYLTNPSLDSSDTYRIEEFNYIIKDAALKDPFGIGFAGGGAISIKAYNQFGGDDTYIPKYLGGDSVLIATLQTSGFMGFFLFVAIYVIFIISTVRLLTCDLTDSQRIIFLVSLSFFLGTFVSLGNLIDVWPIKLYFWSFGAIVMDFQTKISKIPIRSTTSNIE